MDNSNKKNSEKVWPEWALKYRTKNTELRSFDGRIYLYEYSFEYSPELKRTKKISGKMIGRITEEQGLIPKGEKAPRKPRKRTKTPSLPALSDNKEYGITCWMEQCIKDCYYPVLEKVFGSIWQTIVGIVYNRLVFQSPICDMERHMNNSFLSNILTNAMMDDKSVFQVLEWIGLNRVLQVEFFKEYIDKGETLVWDSKLNNETFRNGINIMMAFSTQQNMPVYMRNLPGDITDINAVKFCYSEIEINDGTNIVDKEFSSKKNADSLNDSGIKFIMPLNRSIKLDYSLMHKDEYMPGINGVFIYEST